MKLLHALILSIASLGWHANAHALACGDTITEDITLEGDLSCTKGAYALYVGTPGVTIDFNGYTVSGTGTMDGVRVANASDVSLLFGNLTGFRVGVNASRADRLNVNGMLMYELGSGVIASDSRAVNLVRNTVYSFESWGFFLPAYRGSRRSLGGHNIAANQLAGPSTLIGICGHANSGNTVSGNEMFDGGVLLFDGTSRNEVTGNIMESRGTPAPAITLLGSRHNLVKNNMILLYDKGIGLIPTYTGTCASGPLPLPQVSDNQVTSNDLIIGQTAIVVGRGNVLGRGNQRLPLAFGNLIRENTISSFDLGLHLRTDTFANAAIGNAFFNTFREVHNEGFLNRIRSEPSVVRPGPSRVSVKPVTSAYPSAADARARAERLRPPGKNRSHHQTTRPVLQPRVVRKAL